LNPESPDHDKAAARDAAFAAIGLSADLHDDGVHLEWRGIATVSSARQWTEIPFPGLTARIEVRWIDPKNASVRIDGTSYDLRESIRERSVMVPPDE
jgi:hypothetical protein